MHRLLLLLLVFTLGIVFWANRALFFQPYDGEKWLFLYQNSQYGRGDKADFILSDSQIYALKGYLFVIKHLDLARFEPGHPPLASYFMGLSILTTGNPLWANLTVGLLFFLLLYLFLSRLVSKSLAAFLSLLFLLEPLVSQQLTETTLDLYQLLFALLALTFYSLWWEKPKPVFIALSQFSLGLMLSTKFFLSGLTLPIAFLLATTFSGNFRRFQAHALALTALIAGFLLGHLTYFFDHPSLLEFARYQRYVLNWWAGSPQTPPGGVWDLIFFNRWHTWWETQAIVPVGEWRFTWPLYLLVGLLSPFWLIFRRSQHSPLVWALWLWLVLTLIELSFTAVFPRHLLLVFLPSLILTGLSLKRLLKL